MKEILRPDSIGTQNDTTQCRANVVCEMRIKRLQERGSEGAHQPLRHDEYDAFDIFGAWDI